ncbi:MAG: hypothetical protein Q4D57_01945 [Clostridia bacterium]|nr:hypothetical protein [Clostridia bacterium]
MSKVKIRRFLSLFCCICFMANFVAHLTKNMALATDTCTINVIGDNFSVNTENKAYNYTTDGESSGSMSVVYTTNASDPNPEITDCTPNADGTITDIPVGATVVFALSPNEGFLPQLKINGTDVTSDLTKSTEDENVRLGSITATSGEISVEANFVKSDDASIVLNLKCVVDEVRQTVDYDDNFKSTWATIEYSTDGENYKELDDGTTKSADGQYTFDSSIEKVQLKVSWTNEIMAILDQGLLENGKEVTISKGEHTAIFREAVYTVVWAYPGTGLDEDMTTKNGKVSIDPGEGIRGKEDNTGGAYTVEPGTEVTIHLIPDYGYQFAQGTIGEDVEVTPGQNQSTFTFVMPKDQIVVGDIFTAHPDEVNILTNSLVAGNISGANKVVNSGNAALTISDSVATSEEKTKINSFATEKGLEPVAYLDMELNNFILKGNTGEKWENLLAEIDSPIGISLTLAEDLRKYDSYSIIKVHGNEISVVDTKYSSADGVLNFETDSFSTYVIAKKSGSGASNGVFSVGNLKTGDQNKFWAYTVMMTASILGFIYSFKPQRKQKFRM